MQIFVLHIVLGTDECHFIFPFENTSCGSTKTNSVLFYPANNYML